MLLSLLASAVVLVAGPPSVLRFCFLRSSKRTLAAALASENFSRKDIKSFSVLNPKP
jgi:hypothetical protein